MTRVTVIPEDGVVVVDGVAHQLPQTPPVDANTHAIQFYPETGHATVEKKIGERERLDGDAATELVKPFIDAHAQHGAALKAKAEAEVAARAEAEQTEAARVAKIRTDLAAAEAARGATPQPKGNVTSTGTQAI